MPTGASRRNPRERELPAIGNPYTAASGELVPPGPLDSFFFCPQKRTVLPLLSSLHRPDDSIDGRKFKLLSEIHDPQAFTSIDSAFLSIRCEVCNSGDFAPQLLLCDKCDRGFHLFCLRPILSRVPTGQWYCSKCSVQRSVKETQLTQKKILDFFRIEKPMLNSKHEKTNGDCRRRRRKSGILVISKKRRRMLPFVPSDDLERRLAQMGSLAAALRTMRMKFSNELTYRQGMAPKSANRADLEKGGMQILSREDAQTLELCKAMWSKGESPPLLVVFDPNEGYTVEADALIKDMTLIAEYTGDVDYLRNRENDDCDSMMTLLSLENSSRDLVICPDKRGNIARFINGINNHTQDGRKKQNLKCVRYNVNGECRVLLIALRDISKGERLYYDYNGYEFKYPTEHFV